MALRTIVPLIFALALLALVACNDDGGSDVRTLTVVAHDHGCAPTAFVVEPGRYVQLRLENESSSVFTLRDNEGGFEDIAAEPGEVGEAIYLIPKGTGAYELLCSSDGDVPTNITITAMAAGMPEEATTSDAPSPATSLAVSLANFAITPSERTLSAGRVTFIVTNASSESVHELNILELHGDGSLLKVAGVAPVPPEAGGSVTVDLRRGTYRLACQIGVGESGSIVDHYQRGMWLDISVE